MMGSVLTSRFTGTVTLVGEVPVPVMAIWPVQAMLVAPPVLRSAVLISTLSVLGVALLFWFRTIQLLPQFVVWAFAEKSTVAPVLLVKLRFWAAGSAVPG